MSLKVPNVTLDDLQSFQATHFQVAQDVRDSQDEAYIQDLSSDNDGNLGYYPDGVKRTLTAEQIRIFRHSEIHSLLREKRRALEQQEQGEDETQEEIEGQDRKDAPNAFNNPQKRKLDQVTSHGTRQRGKRLNATRPPVAEAELDYGEEDLSTTRTVDSKPPSFHGRKLKSYGDEDQTELPAAMTQENKPVQFFWPKLGAD